MARVEHVSVTVLEPLTYRGRSVTTGESFDVEPVEALALTFQHQAKFSKPLPRYRTKVSTPDIASEPTRTKRQYRRRDLQAEE